MLVLIRHNNMYSLKLFTYSMRRSSLANRIVFKAWQSGFVSPWGGHLLCGLVGICHDSRSSWSLVAVACHIGHLLPPSRPKTSHLARGTCSNRLSHFHYTTHMTQSLRPRPLVGGTVRRGPSLLFRPISLLSATINIKENRCISRGNDPREASFVGRQVRSLSSFHRC